MRDTMKVYATVRQEVYVDPISVVEQIYIIPDGSWIIEKDGKYINMGDDRYEYEIGEVTKEVYDLNQAKKLLLNYLREKEKKEEELRKKRGR